MAIRAIHANDSPVTIRIGVVKIIKTADVGAALAANICVTLLAQLWALSGQQRRVI